MRLLTFWKGQTMRVISSNSWSSPSSYLISLRERLPQFIRSSFSFKLITFREDIFLTDGSSGISSISLGFLVASLCLIFQSK